MQSTPRHVVVRFTQRLLIAAARLTDMLTRVEGQCSAEIEDVQAIGALQRPAVPPQSLRPFCTQLCLWQAATSV